MAKSGTFHESFFVCLFITDSRSRRFDRRFRVYDISDYGETIRTYKVLESGERIDEMALAGKGAPAFDW